MNESQIGFLRWPAPLRKLAGVLIATALAHGLSGQAPAPSKETSAKSAEELAKELEGEIVLDIEVVSVSKRAQSLFDVASAISVMRDEDILRSGARSYPEIIRQLPGVHAGQVDTGSWGVSIRGFARIFSNKLLVLQDGRSLYTPLFAGTYWDVHDYFLPDIERVEVIRGPGATVWGANAVNGVVNVLTKSAAETLGGATYVDTNSESTTVAGARYGFKLGEKTFARIYAQWREHNDFYDNNGGANSLDRQRGQRAGFRLDSEIGGDGKLMVDGSVYDYRPTTRNGDKLKVSGSHFLADFKKPLAGESSLGVQFYYTFDARDSSTSFYSGRDVYDLEVQHDFSVGKAHKIIWGAGYRLNSVNLKARSNVTWTFARPTYDKNLYSAFLQDEITLVPDALTLTAGAKVEKNDFTDIEVQPSVRLSYTGIKNQTFWASVGRAVRTPSELEGDDFAVQTVARIPFPPPNGTRIELQGNTSAESEVMLAYEVGHRGRWLDKKLQTDFTVFTNRYEGLIQFAPAPMTPGVIPQLAQNALDGHADGVELAVDYRIARNLRAGSSYSHLYVAQYATVPGASRIQDKASPKHQVKANLAFDLTKTLTVDCIYRYQTKFDAEQNTTAVTTIPSFHQADVRVAWAPTTAIDVAVVGRNLLDRRHGEFGPLGSGAYKETTRSVSLTVQARF